MQGKDFESIIRTSLENYEVPYDPAQWELLSARLDQKAQPADQPKKAGKGGYIAAAVITGIAVLTVWLSIPDPKPMQTETTPSAPMNEVPVAPAQVPEQQATVNENETPVTSSESPKVPVTAEVIEKKSTESTEAVTPVSTTVTEPQPEEPLRSVATTPVTPSAIDEKEMPFLPMLAIFGEFNGCENSPVTLSVNPDYLETANFTWFVNDQPAGTGSSVTFTPETPGTIPVKVYATNGINEKEKSVTVEIAERPTADFTFTQDLKRLDAEFPVQFEAIADPNATVKWSFGDGHTAEGVNPEHKFRKNQFYTVTLEVTSATGCTEKITRSIEVLKTNPLESSSAFTPNYDGEHDTFIPERLKTLNLPFELVIFDATMKEVYRTTDASKPWNGRVNNTGELLPTGFYKWTVLLETQKGSTQRFDGDVSLIK